MNKRFPEAETPRARREKGSEAGKALLHGAFSADVPPAVSAATRATVLAQVKRSAYGFTFAPDELKGDREFMMASIKQHGRALQCASEVLKGDREVAMAAVKQTWQALGYASEELKGDREVVMAAVMQHGWPFGSLPRS